MYGELEPMRWFVFVNSLDSNDAAPAQPLCVEAPQWQPALQKARMLRGDTGALASFSIEVLEDGYRAIDPQSRLRYLIQRAPSDAPLSMAVIPKARASAPAISQAPAAPPKEPEPPAALELRLISARDEEPSDDAPLTYCERAYALPKGTPDEEARRLVLEVFDEMRSAFSGEGQHLFLSLAVFDHAFDAKPRRRPIVTLAWKNWKGEEPEIHFPLSEARAQREAEKAAGMKPSPSSSSTASMPAVRPSSISGSMPALASTTKTNPPPSAKRLQGKDLERSLDEGSAALSSSKNALEGADFILQLLGEKFPCELAMVSVYETKAREFVAVRVSGMWTHALSARASEFTPIVRAAFISGDALVVAQAASDSRVRGDERWKALGFWPKSLVCVPLQEEGRALGLLELINPMDGDPFTEDEGKAFTRLGKKLAAFLAAQDG